MEYITSKNINIIEESVVALGNFDGVHIGHSALIEKLLSYKEYKKIIFSFYPHPKTVIAKTKFRTLFTEQEKYDVIKKVGANVFIEYPVDKTLLNMTGQQFIEKILYEKLNCKVVIVGENFKFGKNKAYDVIKLEKTCNQYGIDVVKVKHVMLTETEKVSSTKIRELLLTKEIETVNKLLGKPYFVLSEVVKGKQLGKTIGFPTINFKPNNDKLLPPRGVYLTETIIKGEKYKSITNVGVNPTVEDREEKIIETHILNFNKDLYGQKIKVNFLKWLRDEKKFNSLEELKTQLEKDMKVFE